MKKVFIVVLIFSILLTSCQKEEPIFDNFMQDYVTSNKLDLDELLTASYSIDELTNYFGTVNENEFALQDVESSIVYRTFWEVNETFPVECFRKGIYTVYKVQEGGYFYVFWSQQTKYNQFTEEGIPIRPYTDPRKPEDFSVYFTAYLPDLNVLKTKSDFDSIICGVSTAEDVFAIDANMELCFLYDHGIFSYSLLKDGYVMEIKYYNPQNGADNRSELIVNELAISKKNEINGCLQYVLKKDLPN